MAFGKTQDHIMYKMCAKFHPNPCINLGGIGGTNLCLRTDRQTDSSNPTPPNFVAGGIITAKTRVHRTLYTRLKDNTITQKVETKKPLINVKYYWFM